MVRVATMLNKATPDNTESRHNVLPIKGFKGIHFLTRNGLGEFKNLRIYANIDSFLLHSQSLDKLVSLDIKML